MSKQPVTVFVVDDHALFRTGVKAELAGLGDDRIAVVGEAGSVGEAVVRITSDPPAVVGQGLEISRKAFGLIADRARGIGAFVGLIAGMASVAAVTFGAPSISFLWHNVIGAVVVVAVGLVISMFEQPKAATAG